MQIEHWELLVSILIAVLMSSGWSQFLERRRAKNSQELHLLRGLASSVILMQASGYIERGCITSIEYKNLCDGLIDPYLALVGHNSLIEKIAADLKRLPSDLPCSDQANNS